MRRMLLILVLIVLASAARVRLPALQAGLETDRATLPLNAGDATNYPNCRFGVGATGDVSSYDTGSLNLGWYVNWGTALAPATPGGTEFVQMVRLEQEGADGWDFAHGETVTGTLNVVAANPGATWLIGNEPDSPFQDDMVPQAYAHAYHDVYYLIKGADPTARVGIGGVVQPTPLRMAYLDQVWNTYYQTYSETLPVDFWNIHTFILRETAVAPDPEPCGPNTIPVWGAYIPPGSTAETGELYCLRDQDNLAIFGQRIRDFRQWMAEKGQRDKPLIITEYGVLFPEDYVDEDGISFSQTRVGTFMSGTFELMLNERDPLIGYPYDDNRLVQRWAWFSLSEDPHAWGGTLYDPSTHELRPLGQTFRDYTHAITPTVDLLAARAYADPAVQWYEGQPVTATLKAVLSNIGNVSTTQSISVTFYDGPPDQAGSNPIGEVQTIVGGLQGCAGYGEAEVQWPERDAGAHWFYVQVDSTDDVSEADENNNVANGLLLLATQRSFLPLIARDSH